MKLVAAVILLVLAVTGMAFAADPTGKWKATLQDGGMELTFTFKLEGDKLTGTVAGEMGEFQISEGKVEGDNIGFTVSTDQFKVVHKGVIAGNEIKLKADMGDQAFDMILKKI